MTTYGVTSTGFTKKTLPEILAEIEAEQRDTISPDLDQLATSLLGQLNGIVGDKFREAWDVLEAVYRAFYPDSAIDEALDQVASITGTYRLAAESSTVTLDQLNVGAGVTIPAGSIVRVGATGPRFVTLAAVVNALAYPVTASVAAESEDTGAIVGNARTIDTIVTAVAGWSAQAAETCTLAEPYALVNGQTLTIEIDEGVFQTVTFNTGDFVDIGNALAAEVAAVITTDLTNGGGQDAGGYVRGFSDLNGSGSAWKVTGGTAAAAFAFSGNLIKGFNSLDAEAGND